MFYKVSRVIDGAILPDGVFNVIQGDKNVVDMLLQSADNKSTSFVGSTPVAKYIYENSAKNLKRVQSLEVLKII